MKWFWIQSLAIYASIWYFKYVVYFENYSMKRVWIAQNSGCKILRKWYEILRPAPFRLAMHEISIYITNYTSSSARKHWGDNSYPLYYFDKENHYDIFKIFQIIVNICASMFVSSLGCISHFTAKYPPSRSTPPLIFWKFVWELLKKLRVPLWIFVSFIFEKK